VYDVPVANATGASSAAPLYFEPKLQTNEYGLVELQIDGGVICNNPSLYAYQLAKQLRDKKRMRVLSIGTGEKSFTPWESAEEFTKVDYLVSASEFMMNMDSYTAHNYLKWNFRDAGHSSDYLRLQTISNLGMDKVD